MPDLQEPDAIKEWFNYDFPMVDDTPRCPTCGAEEVVVNGKGKARNPVSPVQVPGETQSTDTPRP